MIVSDRYDGPFQLVKQMDHAHVSGEIARAWRRPSFFTESLWEEFAVAVYHHDDGWEETDNHPPVDAHGRPVNFKNGPAQQHIDIWRQSIESALRNHGPFVQLFITAHVRWLHTHIAPPDNHDQDLASSFTAELNQMIDHHLNTLGQQERYRDVLTPQAFEQCRSLFSFFDALSLVFAKGLDWMSFTDYLPVGQDIQKMKIHSEICAIRWGRMTPWPFVEDDVTFRLTYKRVKGKAYVNSEELQKALESARPITQPFTLGRL